MVAGKVIAGSGNAYEMAHHEKFVRVLPRENCLQSIRAGDEEQLGTRTNLREVANSIDGVRRAGPVDINPAHPETWVGCGRYHRHQIPVFGGADLSFGLLPRLSGRDENHLVQVEQVGDLTSRHQVPMVDRVEGATHDPDAARCGAGKL